MPNHTRKKGTWARSAGKWFQATNLPKRIKTVQPQPKTVLRYSQTPFTGLGGNETWPIDRDEFLIEKAPFFLGFLIANRLGYPHRAPLCPKIGDAPDSLLDISR